MVYQNMFVQGWQRDSLWYSASQRKLKDAVIESFFQISLCMKIGSGSQICQYIYCSHLWDKSINFTYITEIWIRELNCRNKSMQI